ncbi:MAG: ATPase, T2SS/T4P/T4SS family [Phycisphaerales bacterium]
MADLATLHTHDAPSAISRLQDIGIEPFLISSSLLAVLGQRLLRKTCQVCSGAGESGAGRCSKCHGTGYSGRIAIYELMPVSDEIRRLTMQRADAVELAHQAQREGMATMLADGRAKIARGLTTETELKRVIHESDADTAGA